MIVVRLHLEFDLKTQISRWLIRMGCQYATNRNCASCEWESAPPPTPASVKVMQPAWRKRLAGCTRSGVLVHFINLRPLVLFPKSVSVSTTDLGNAVRMHFYPRLHTKIKRQKFFLFSVLKKAKLVNCDFSYKIYNFENTAAVVLL